MTADYRNTPYCPNLDGVKERKEAVKIKILQYHPRVVNFYKLVRKDYKQEYLKAYNYKCCYCGNSIENIQFKSFEIDHYINKANFENQKEANAIENLFISCFDCNRNKSDYNIQPTFPPIIHNYVFGTCTSMLP